MHDILTRPRVSSSSYSEDGFKVVLSFVNVSDSAGQHYFSMSAMLGIRSYAPEGRFPGGVELFPRRRPRPMRPGKATRRRRLAPPRRRRRCRGRREVRRGRFRAPRRSSHEITEHTAGDVYERHEDQLQRPCKRAEEVDDHGPYSECGDDHGVFDHERFEDLSEPELYSAPTTPAIATLRAGLWVITTPTVRARSRLYAGRCRTL